MSGLSSGAAKVVAWDAVAEKIDASDVGKRRIEGNGASLVRVAIPSGTKADRHAHPHEQFVQVLSGTGALTTEAGESRFAAGSVFHIPADTWHEAIFDTDTVLVETNLAAR